MGVGWGMAKAWLGAIREGYRARQTMAHLSRSRWKYLGKRLHQHQKGRGLNQTGSGLGIPLAMLASWGINKIRQKIQKGSGKQRKRRRKKITRRTHTLLTQ